MNTQKAEINFHSEAFRQLVRLLVTQEPIGSAWQVTRQHKVNGRWTTLERAGGKASFAAALTHAASFVEMFGVIQKNGALDFHYYFPGIQFGVDPRMCIFEIDHSVAGKTSFRFNKRNSGTVVPADVTINTETRAATLEFAAGAWSDAEIGDLLWIIHTRAVVRSFHIQN